MAAPLLAVPRELVHIISRFAPVEAIFFARSHRASWQCFSCDAHMWEKTPFEKTPKPEGQRL